MTKPRITATDYKNPYRPKLVRAFNSLLPLAKKLGMQPNLSVTHLEKKARRVCKGRNFASYSFETALEQLVWSIEREANLHLLGRLITQKRLVNILVNRLRIEAVLEANPEIANIPILPPILICGLQRTGTTILHRLLAAHPRLRALRSYEALNPAPIHTNLEKDIRQKRATAKSAERALAYLAPDFFAIHPVEADAPEEDVLLLDYTFISTVAEATLRVPTFARWIERSDHLPAYRYLRTLLQVLSWRSTPQPFVLKSPHHLEFLDTFLSVFPDATVVFTHRDPRHTLPSFCSMMAHGRGLFSEQVDPIEIGATWLRKTAHMVTAGNLARQAHPNTTFIDVQYDELINNPLKQVSAILQQAKIPTSQEATRAMRQSLDRNQQHRFGIHRYDMADFGLTEEKMYAAYKPVMPNGFFS